MKGECFMVHDATGFAVAYCYFKTREIVGTDNRNLMTRDEARRIAINIAKSGAREAAVN